MAGRGSGKIFQNFGKARGGYLPLDLLGGPLSTGLLIANRWFLLYHNDYEAR